MSELKLPKVKSGISKYDPNFCVIFGQPKAGKTTAMSLLDNNLIIDLEKGTVSMEALKVEVNTIQELFKVADMIEKEGKPYKYITIDSATKLEDDIIGPLAKKMYCSTPMGKSFEGEDVRKLPNGAGYLYIRDAFKFVIDKFTPLCDTLILVAHCNEKMIDKDGKEMYQMEMDLSGKLKRIIAAKADAVGLLYRKGNQTMLNFNGGGDAIIEARSPHLTNKEFVLVEKAEDGTYTNHWNQIFIDK